MYIIWQIEPGKPPLSPSTVLAESPTLAGIHEEAVSLHDAGHDWGDLYLFNEDSGELGLSAEWLEEWIAGKREWPAE